MADTNRSAASVGSLQAFFDTFAEQRASRRRPEYQRQLERYYK